MTWFNTASIRLWPPPVARSEDEIGRVELELTDPLVQTTDDYRRDRHRPRPPDCVHTNTSEMRGGAEAQRSRRMTGRLG